MQSDDDVAELLDELFDRCSILAELDGPQIEAWLSGLLEVFDSELTASGFVEHALARDLDVGVVVAEGIASLTAKVDQDVADEMHRLLDSRVSGHSFGTSELADAWSVEAPFGASLVLGFGTGDLDADHSVLVDLDEGGQVRDLQLAGPAALLIEEVSADTAKVQVREIDTDDALDQVVAGWPEANVDELGPGFASNQAFVRSRVANERDLVLADVAVVAHEFDTKRGLDDEEAQDANAAAYRAVESAVGKLEIGATHDDQLSAAWASVIEGGAGALSRREREGLLWLEWADWTGVIIGLLRRGADVEATGAAMVDLVNRCPEVSSTIDKRDRDYAEWAFEIAIELLRDHGIVEADRFTGPGLAALPAGVAAVWGSGV